MTFFRIFVAVFLCLLHGACGLSPVVAQCLATGVMLLPPANVLYLMVLNV
jgi:hypothetical protein